MPKILHEFNANKVRKAIKEIPEGKRDVAISLLDEVIFMQSAIAELKENINANGVMVRGRNGFQENPCVKSYGTYISKYTTLSKLLLATLPEEEKEVKSELLEFIQG